MSTCTAPPWRLVFLSQSSPVLLHRSPPTTSRRLSPLSLLASLSSQVKQQDVMRPFNGHIHSSIKSVSYQTDTVSVTFPSSSSMSGAMNIRRDGVCFAMEDNEVATESSSADSSGLVGSNSNNQPPSPLTESSASDPSTTDSTQAMNASKRAPLTAREKLRAARVLARYTETKPPKSKSGNKVLDALRESDKGKRVVRLPEAPTDMFDDGNRGLPKAGWTFDFPGGSDLLIIAFSFVFISTVMFATTYIVWKVGAIHFNEY